MKMLSLDDAIKAITMLLDCEDDTDLIWSCDVINNLKNAPSVVDVEQTQKWISVKDRLPEKNGCYLVFASYIDTAWFAESLCDVPQFDYEDAPDLPGFYNGDGEGDWIVNGITHWMPLPELPKEDA